ncbi:hypothetical protein evm_014705 [Chilo suppressalis]|nr:hypothetical protein evm_014705 [Chilo suppressalis]
MGDSYPANRSPGYTISLPLLRMYSNAPEQVTQDILQPTQRLRIEGGIATPPIEAPVTPFHTSAHYCTPEQATPTPGRALWAASAGSGGSSSQPASLEADLSSHSPYPRRRTFDTCASPPPPVRRVSADSRWRPSPQSSGNTSPIVLQRFYHQSQQRRSRADLHAAPRHRSLSREHSTGRSPEPPPRTSRQHPMLGHDAPHSIVDDRQRLIIIISLLMSPLLGHRPSLWME